MRLPPGQAPKPGSLLQTVKHKPVWMPPSQQISEPVAKTQEDQRAIRRVKPLFDYLTLAVITLNGLWIGIDLDLNPSDTLPRAPIGFQLVENLFCIFFSAEVVIRLVAFDNKIDALKNFQFVFDAALVILMVMETWVMYFVVVAFGGGASVMAGAGALSLLRMMRLTRIFRVARILRSVPELMVLIKGLAAASRAVAWTLCLLVLIIYIFAVAFRIMTSNNELAKPFFKSVPTAMVTLLLPGLLPDNAEPVMAMGEANMFFAAFFLCFIVVGSITLMNMLIGVLCESVSAVAAYEKEGLNLTYVKSELEALLQSLGRDPEDLFTKPEIESVLLDPKAASVFKRVDVDLTDLVDVADFHLFGQKGEIAFSKFLEMVMELRGSNSAIVKDIVNLRKFMVDEMWKTEDRLLAAVDSVRSGLTSDRHKA